MSFCFVLSKNKNFFCGSVYLQWQLVKRVMVIGECGALRLSGVVSTVAACWVCKLFLFLFLFMA